MKLPPGPSANDKLADEPSAGGSKAVASGLDDLIQEAARTRLSNKRQGIHAGQRSDDRPASASWSSST